jgi:hypothetical protein
MALAVGFVVSLLLAIRAYFVATHKGRSEAWAIGTLFFTPLFLVLVFLPPLIEPSEKTRFSNSFDIVAAVFLVVMYGLSASAYLAHHKSNELPTCDSRAVADATIKALEKNDPDAGKIGVVEIKPYQVFATQKSRQCRAMVKYKDSSFDRILINIERQGSTWSLEFSYED